MNNRIAVFNAGISVQNGRRYIFVAHRLAVRILHMSVTVFYPFFGVSGPVSGGACNRIVSPVRQRPFRAPVHGVIPAHYSSDGGVACLFHNLFQHFKERKRTARRRIPAVREKMYPHLGYSAPFRLAEKRVKMILMRVNTLVLDQSHKMQC